MCVWCAFACSIFCAVCRLVVWVSFFLCFWLLCFLKTSSARDRWMNWSIALTMFAVSMHTFRYKWFFRFVPVCVCLWCNHFRLWYLHNRNQTANTTTTFIVDVDAARHKHQRPSNQTKPTNLAEPAELKQRSTLTRFWLFINDGRLFARRCSRNPHRRRRWRAVLFRSGVHTLSRIASIAAQRCFVSTPETCARIAVLQFASTKWKYHYTIYTGRSRVRLRARFARYAPAHQTFKPSSQSSAVFYLSLSVSLSFSKA